MNFYTDLSDEELLALTSEQINDLAKLELVKDGLPLPYLKPEIKKVEDFEPEAVCELFEVEGLGVYFFTVEDAEACRSALLKGVRGTSEFMPGIHKNIPVKPVTGFEKPYEKSIAKVKFYTPEMAKLIKKHVVGEENVLKPIQEWEKVETDYQTKRSQVLDSIYDAQARRSRLESEKSYMDECLRLADGDKVIAKRFFEKRFPPVEKEASSDEFGLDN